MNKLAITVVVSVLAAGPLWPQSPNQAQTAGQPRIAPGSVIPVQLTKTVDAKKAKAGDEVVAKVTQDMKTNAGEVLVPKDTRVIGHVTEAQARHKNEKESQLAIAFDRAILKNEQVNLPMSIQAVIAPQNDLSDANDGPATEPTPSSAGTSQTSPMAGRSPMGVPGQPQSSLPPPDEGSQKRETKLPPINAQTQGVIGISHVILSPAANGTQGSVLTSQKNNVKLESGTMLLLRVNK